MIIHKEFHSQTIKIKNEAIDTLLATRKLIKMTNFFVQILSKHG